jgi:hypothetical protein
MKTAPSYMWKFLLVIAIAGSLTSCGTTNTSKGASTGAIVGGLVDGWGGAAAGAIIGGGIGYAVDHSEDKKKGQELKEREVAALEKSSISSDPKTAYRPANSNPLTGSTWRVISLVDDEKKTPEFKSMVLSFQTNTRATTLILWADGRTETYSESYTIVDDALVLSGKDYVTNAKYSINNKQMVLVTPKMRVVLEEVEEGA